MNINVILTGNLPQERERKRQQKRQSKGKGARINESERESKRTEHSGSFHAVKPSEAGDYWLMGRCEHCVIINIWDSLHGGTLMMLLA